MAKRVHLLVKHALTDEEWVAPSNLGLFLAGFNFSFVHRAAFIVTARRPDSEEPIARQLACMPIPVNRGDDRG